MKKRFLLFLTFLLLCSTVAAYAAGSGNVDTGGGDYAILLEPMAYYKFRGVKYGCPLCGNSRTFFMGG